MNARHCEFRHLVVEKEVPAGVLGPEPVRYVGHVHEDEALWCAYMERLGWPQPQPQA